MTDYKDDCSKCRTVMCSEFPAVPVRHKKIMDKLARCGFCGRLCCCIEHCLMHESEHTESDPSTRNRFTARTHEWIDFSEFSLSPDVAKNVFPFFCVYCRIKVDNEKDLKALVEHGEQCPIKKCHWMVPITIYQEEKREKKNKNIGVYGVGRPVPRPHIAARRPRENSLLRLVLRNSLNLSLSTPPPANCEAASQTIGPLTSTPENDCVAITQLGTSTCSSAISEEASSAEKERSTNERVGILSTAQRNRIRKIGTTRKVTFACDPEVENNEPDGSENEPCNAKNDEVACENKKENKNNMKSESKH